jgi:hypothetical protein
VDRTLQFVRNDISKTRLALAIYPQDAFESATHDEPGVVRVVNRLQALQPPSMVLEAAGGLERGLAAAQLSSLWSTPGRCEISCRPEDNSRRPTPCDARILAALPQPYAQPFARA